MLQCVSLTCSIHCLWFVEILNTSVFIVLIFILAWWHTTEEYWSIACWRPYWEDASSTKSFEKVSSWFCSSQKWHPPRLGCDCLSNSCKSGVLGCNQGGHRGNNSQGAKSRWERRMTAGASKSPNNVTSIFFNAVHLLPKDLRFEHWCAKVASCPGRHLTSLRPCRGGQTTTFLTNFNIAILHNLPQANVCYEITVECRIT